MYISNISKYKYLYFGPELDVEPPKQSFLPYPPLRSQFRECTYIHIEI